MHLNGFRPSFIAHRLKSIDDHTPLLKGSNTIRPKCIDVRVFSLGVLFIGGVIVGGYMLHQQGAFSSRNINRLTWLR